MAADMNRDDSDRLVRIETLLEGVDHRMTDMVTKDNDHENRIRRLEKILYIGIGFAAATGSAIGSLAGRIL